jgi:transposase
MLLTRPDNVKAEQHELLAKLTAACPEMTQLAEAIADFAPLLAPHADNADAFTSWIAHIRAADLPHLHAFTRGLDRDLDAVIAGLTLAYSNGPTEGVNTKTKRIAPPDARTSRIHPAPPPHPPRITAPSVTTESETGPLTGLCLTSGGSAE